MSCVLYSHSDRGHKSHWKVSVSATFGPHFRLHGGTHLSSDILPLCQHRMGQAGTAFRILLPRGSKYFPCVMRSEISWLLWAVKGQWGMEEFRNQKPVFSPQAQSLSATSKSSLGDPTSFTVLGQRWRQDWQQPLESLQLPLQAGRSRIALPNNEAQSWELEGLG